MAKTQEELNAIKEEVKTLNKKLVELTDEELEQVTGGVMPIIFASVVHDVRYNNNSWNSDKLPTEPGSYKLNKDVVINDKWLPQPGKTSLS